MIFFANFIQALGEQLKVRQQVMKKKWQIRDQSVQCANSEVKLSFFAVEFVAKRIVTTLFYKRSRAQSCIGKTLEESLSYLVLEY